VVMESPHSGLALVSDIRGEFGMVASRIILRTGQPGYAPEMTVIRDYDIDGYLAKEEMTRTRLYSAVVSAVRTYRLIQGIEANRRGLRWLIDASVERKGSPGRASFAETVLEFVAMVTHEFRSSVNTIGAALEILEARRPEATHQPEVSKIRRGMERLHALIEACAFEDRLHCPARPAPAQAVDVGSLLREVVADTVPPAREADLRLSLDAGPLPLVGDPALIGTALSNVIDNAIKYSAPGTALEIAAGVDGTTVVIAVADRGPGIPEEERARVFEKYYRSPGDASVRGTGLGLHIVRQVLDLHGGEASVAARDGGGTVFTLRLPTGKPARRAG